MVTTERKKWKRRSRENSMYGNAESKDPFPISRSKLELCHSCPRCFWLDRVKGIGRPGIPGFLLNTLVDTLLKREFDAHREAGTPHPYMVQNGMGHMVPLDHPMMDEWRENFKGVRAPKYGLMITGAVDDIWKSGDGDTEEWYVVDYKSTASNANISAELFLEDIYKGGYVRQMAIYQWLLRELGHPVSTRGRATRIFQDRIVGSNTLHDFQERDEQMALIELKEFDKAADDHNIFDNYDVFGVIDRQGRRTF